MKEKFTLSLFFIVFIAAKSEAIGFNKIPAADTSIRANARNEDLFLLGKVWGFLKYYHPNIAAGKYDWDKELMLFLPGFSKVTSKKERSDSLLAWINKFGDIPACTTCNDSVLVKAKLLPNFKWINAANFSPELLSLLDHIRRNRIQSGLYYIKANQFDGVNFITFQHESPYSSSYFPSDTYGLVGVFRFWNAIEYWYAYKYNLPVAWDEVLKNSISKILQHKNLNEYFLTLEELITGIHDSHGFFNSFKTEELIGYYYMPFRIKIVEQKVLVTSYLNDSLAWASGIRVGDIIESIDGVRIEDVIKRMSLYCPASNEGSLGDKLVSWLTRTQKKQSVIVVRRKREQVTITTSNFIPKPYPPVRLNTPYFTYQKDSAFCIIGNGIGYINIGNFNRKDSAELKEMVRKTRALIIDNRQNQDEANFTGGGDIVGNLIMPPKTRFVRFTMAEPLYPGVFRFAPTTMEFGSEDYYKGHIIILANEGTISVGEMNTMAFQTAPKAKVLGTTTAGADGNVTYITLPGGLAVQYTGLGVYYPDGRETQRVGIKPDIIVKQTIAGFLQQKDEQLEKAVNYLSSRQ